MVAISFCHGSTMILLALLTRPFGALLQLRQIVASLAIPLTHRLEIPWHGHWQLNSTTSPQQPTYSASRLACHRLCHRCPSH
eukprot:scaffold34901_cov59-Attheya_sp.AAC.2